MGKLLEGIFIGIFVSVAASMLLLFLTKPAEDFLNRLEVVGIAQYTGEFCPTGIYFNSFNNDKIADFSVKLKNIGDNGNLFVTLASDEFLIRYNNEKEFKVNSTKIWNVGANQEATFDFKLKPTPGKIDQENVSVSISRGCYEEVMGININCKPSKICCNYKKQEYSDGYNLNNEK